MGGSVRGGWRETRIGRGRRGYDGLWRNGRRRGEGAEGAAFAGGGCGGFGERVERGDGEAEFGSDCYVSPAARVAGVSFGGGVGGRAGAGVWVERCGDIGVSGGWEDFLWDAEVAAGVGCGKGRVMGVAWKCRVASGEW